MCARIAWMQPCRTVDLEARSMSTPMEIISAGDRALFAYLAP
jgi:hypothetical protein